MGCYSWICAGKTLFWVEVVAGGRLEAVSGRRRASLLMVNAAKADGAAGVSPPDLRVGAAGALDRAEGVGSKPWSEKDGWGHRRWLDARRWETSGGRCWVAAEDGDGAGRRWLRSVRVLLVGVEIRVAWRLMNRGRRLVCGHGRWIGCEWMRTEMGAVGSELAGVGRKAGSG
ncbi:hypothetical protein ACLOJK_017969 [Asimina triloba]